MKAIVVLLTLVLVQQAVSADAEKQDLLLLRESSGTRILVLSKDSSVKARIETKANELLKETQTRLGPSSIVGIVPQIVIDVSPSAEEAKGSTTYVPVGGNRIRDIRVELRGSIEGILNDLLPREISHIVFAEQIGVPPRWADLGVGFLAESGPTREERWARLREARDAGTLIPLGDLLTLDKYPKEADEVRLVYAQSMAVVQYIVQHWGYPSFVTFAGDAKRMTPGEALQAHFGFEAVGDFDLAFRQWAASK